MTATPLLDSLRLFENAPPSSSLAVGQEYAKCDSRRINFDRNGSLSVANGPVGLSGVVGVSPRRRWRTARRVRLSNPFLILSSAHMFLFLRCDARLSSIVSTHVESIGTLLQVSRDGSSNSKVSLAAFCALLPDFPRSRSDLCLLLVLCCE